MEGQEVTPTQEGEWYLYTHYGTELNIIYKNGAGWNGDTNQTVDMYFTESTCIEIIAGEGKATYTLVDCNATAVEDITVSKNATKIIRNGQLYIIRDGVMFNVLGQITE